VRLLELLLEHRAVPFGGDPFAGVSGVGQEDQLEGDRRIVAETVRLPDGPEAALVEGLLAFGRISTDLPRHRCCLRLSTDG
jgi:hypothetical protein